jgi:WD40 repeat protein
MTFARLFATPALTAFALLQPAPPRAELFAPGVISTRDYERDGAFTPDGKTFYFTKRTMWPYFSAICVSRLRNGKWSEPEVASFSGQYGDVTPFVSRDGNRLYFASHRPVNGARSSFYNLWMVTRDSVSQSWSEPTRLSDEINGKEGAIAPVETRDGSLYFVSGELGHIVVAKHRTDGWDPPVPAGDSSATGSIELGAYVDPDQRYMIVSVIGREDALHSAEGIYPRADLYVRTRAGNGWSALRHLGAPVNSGADELAPFVSPDGRYLYFTSERGALTEHGAQLDYDALETTLHAPGNGLGDIYRIELSSAGILP